MSHWLHHGISPGFPLILNFIKVYV
jgi:hypothetical protein